MTEVLKVSPTQDNRRSEVLQASPTQDNRRSEVLQASPSKRSEVLQASPTQDNRRSEVLQASPTQENRRSEVLQSSPTQERRSEALKETPKQDNRRSEALKETPKQDNRRSEVLKESKQDIRGDEVLKSYPRDEGKPIVDVFTHSTTGFPGAWPEEDVEALLDSWQEVVETARTHSKRFGAAQRVQRRMKRRGYKFNRDDIIQQMKVLRTEYKVYLGLLKIGIPTVRAKCVTQLERILGGRDGPIRRQETMNQVNSHVDAGLSEDSDQSHRLSVSYSEGQAEEAEANNDQPELTQETVEKNNEEEAVGQNRRVRFQRRITVRRLIQQQQASLDQVQKLMQVNEESNAKVIELLGELVVYQKEVVANQHKILEALSAKDSVVEP